ncbi:hypothetical protein [Actinacidiphila sp. ITFR-21]|uniref:hypothetical protein n=1 Tax=Actinacidiphila sp. ITFR-21 TaxID=3075199 RepID=UPI00288915F1|nr:hypothetical protein [Streptomyces sp. ITFR-21]WNI16920.1 hypothetical protein RLT57_16250 [Streptomyces sp. ITFR-21]
MAGTGPVPNPQTRRRNAQQVTPLPAAGREGEAPVWPLLDDVAMVERRDAARRLADELELALLEPELTGRKRTAAQKKLDAARTEANILGRQLEAAAAAEGGLWADLWALPQAVMWERQRSVREVAQYVRWKIKAELGDLDASKEARMLADRLGLNPMSMARLRWEVGDEGAAGRRAARAPRRTGDTRARLRAVGDEG